MRDEQWERAGPTTELVPRRATDLVLDMLGSFRGVVVQGARQVGKSTLAGLVADRLGAPVVTLDDEAERLAAIDDPGLFLDTPVCRPSSTRSNGSAIHSCWRSSSGSIVHGEPASTC